MPKAALNAYDAYALLEKHKLYKNQLKEVLIDELQAKKVLCVSDTTDVLIKSGAKTRAIAHVLEQSGLGKNFEVIGSDYVEFRPLYSSDDENPEAPKFGTHLPQNIDATRREYMKVDATSLSKDLSSLKNVDVILGRNCICACAGNQKLCCEVGISVESQQSYLEHLMRLNPSLMVLSAAGALFSSSSEQQASQDKAQSLYKEAYKNMITACKKLNEKNEKNGSPHKFVIVEMDSRLRYMATHKKNENGYMLVGYDSSKVDFQLSTVSLEKDRQMKKKIAEEDNSGLASDPIRKSDMSQLVKDDSIDEASKLANLSPRAYLSLFKPASCSSSEKLCSSLSSLNINNPT